MLGPYDRLQLVSELRPPDGFEFDRGFGTTYSLDLESMLIVPLSLVLLEFESREDALSNPEAVLEGLRRMAGKLHIFCQRGRIKRPSEGLPQFSFLEEMLIDVKPRIKQTSFHPKVWLLRYRKDREVLLRLLVLSRNLTFDKSWDAALVLDGMLRADRPSSVQANGRLVQFIEALIELAGPAKSRVSAALQSLIKDVPKTEFEVPEGFGGYSFWPLGIDSASPNHLFQGPHGRFFAMSPFVTDLSSSSRSKGVLDVLLDKRTSVANNVLVSRTEELDCLAPQSIAALKETTDIYVLDEAAAAQAEPDEEVPATPAAVPDAGTLSGLHAKVYVVENGAQVSVFTGSANATSSGWGRLGTPGNVEFMVELFGARQSVGVDVMLGNGKAQEKGAQSLRNLLKPYTPPTEPLEVNADVEKVKDMLRDARADLAAADFRVEVSEEAEKNTYKATLVVPKDLDLEGAQAWAWPIMLPQGRLQEIKSKGKAALLEYAPLTIIALTPFWAFRVRAKAGKVEETEDFVLRLPVSGMPDGRISALLAHMINNSDRFLRYLQFLLLDDPMQPGGVPHRKKGRGPDGSEDPAAGLASQIIFEDLVRAYSRNPERLDRIEGLISDLKKGGAGADVVPPDFEEIWEPFKTLRARERANKKDD